MKNDLNKKSNTKNYFYIFLALLFAFSYKAFPQTSINSFSFGLGTGRSDNFLSFFPQESKNNFYSEFQFGGVFLKSGFDWAINYCHWNKEDLPKQSTSYAFNYLPISSTGHIIGIRFGIDFPKALKEWILPIKIFLGFSHHFLSYKYDFQIKDAPSSTKFKENFTSMDYGLVIYFKIIKHIQIYGQVECFSQLTNNLIPAGAAGIIGLSYIIQEK